MAANPESALSRISVSLPSHLLLQLDEQVRERGFESRSQAIVRMLSQQLTEHEAELGEQIMAGVISLVYDHARPGLQSQLAEIQHRHVDEVISSLHVQLMQSHTLEVILVQGPSLKLQVITDALRACKGVVSGHLQLSAVILPPVHPLPNH